jgi:hypothetical protein
MASCIAPRLMSPRNTETQDEGASIVDAKTRPGATSRWTLFQYLDGVFALRSLRFPVHLPSHNPSHTVPS